ncbi:hypothetical protein GCM10020331_097720 [Ectobacillus funiculus]
MRLFAPLAFPFDFSLFVVAYILIGGEIVARAIKNIARGQVFDENFLMAIATLGAFAIGEYSEGVAVMLFYQIGELFQSLAVNRSRKIHHCTDGYTSRLCKFTSWKRNEAGFPRGCSDR